jgi:hypothetical protein
MAGQRAHRFEEAAGLEVGGDVVDEGGEEAVPRGEEAGGEGGSVPDKASAGVDVGGSAGVPEGEQQARSLVHLEGGGRGSPEDHAHPRYAKCKYLAAALQLLRVHAAHPLPRGKPRSCAQAHPAGSERVALARKLSLAV